MQPIQGDGRKAEAYITELLRAHHWEVIARNWRRRGCELDIVAWKDALLIVVEVKFRRRFRPLASDVSQLLSARKQAALKRGALAFISSGNFLHIQSIRFDLAIVVGASARGEGGEVERPRVFYYCNVLSM